MPREVPILNLGEVADLVSGGPDSANKLFHAYGIFKKEVQAGLDIRFCLFDENKEIEIRAAGDQSEYPRPKPGDIVRIHRLRVNSEFGIAEIPRARNVVVWPAFQHEPAPRSVARSPTISEEDHTRRRILESYFCSRISKLIDLSSSRLFDQRDAVAGRVEGVSTDRYGHLEIEISDGTGNMTLRVFRKFPDRIYEDDTHFRIASQLKNGEYIIATNIKLAPNKRLNLSANLSQGRSLRRVEESSILGTKLAESIAAEAQQSRSQSLSSSQSQSHSSDIQSQRRRSPRFLKQNQDENRPLDLSSSPNSGQAVVLSVDTSNESTQQPPEVFPKFTPYCDIPRKDNGYDFYNLVGQVRDKPRRTINFGNCILQIFDGSLNEYPNHYAYEVENPLEGCLIVCVYSKQKDFDTNEHFDKASSLSEGDLIYMTNVKISFVAGRIKAELNANKFHNKSITVVDKQSPFGKKILNMAETPQVAELREAIDPSSGRYSDFEDDDDGHQ